MKVEGPMKGYGFTSKDVLPASCTTKQQVSCTSIPKPTFNEGYTNQEIYEGIMSLRNHIVSLFGGGSKKTHPVNYFA